MAGALQNSVEYSTAVDRWPRNRAAIRSPRYLAGIRTCGTKTRSCRSRVLIICCDTIIRELVLPIAGVGGHETAGSIKDRACTDVALLGEARGKNATHGRMACLERLLARSLHRCIQ